MLFLSVQHWNPAGDFRSLPFRGVVQAVDSRQRIVLRPKFGDDAFVDPGDRLPQLLHILAREFILSDRFTVQLKRDVCKNLFPAKERK